MNRSIQIGWCVYMYVRVVMYTWALLYVCRERGEGKERERERVVYVCFGCGCVLGESKRKRETCSQYLLCGELCIIMYACVCVLVIVM